MKFIDTHAHLDSPRFELSLDELLDNAREAGVERIVTIGASREVETNWEAIEIARAHDWIRCTVGIHPHDADEANEETVARIRRELAEDEQVVGIGETGLDYFYDNAPVEQQKWSFRQFLEMSKEVDKPVVIHSRDADEDTVELIKDTGVTGGILHCFTGGRAMAEELFELDFYLSFSGIVTFNSAKELLEIACDVPEDRILFETDSPFLAPTPHRGEKNQPAYVKHTAARIAQARGVDLDEFTEIVWENAARVFGWE